MEQWDTSALWSFSNRGDTSVQDLSAVMGHISARIILQSWDGRHISTRLFPQSLHTSIPGSFCNNGTVEHVSTRFFLQSWDSGTCQQDSGTSKYKVLSAIMGHASIRIFLPSWDSGTIQCYGLSAVVGHVRTRIFLQSWDSGTIQCYGLSALVGHVCTRIFRQPWDSGTRQRYGLSALHFRQTD